MVWSARPSPIRSSEDLRPCPRPKAFALVALTGRYELDKPVAGFQSLACYQSLGDTPESEPSCFG